MKKEINCWEVEIKFNIRMGSHSAKTKKELQENIENGIGNNEMNCIEEDYISKERCIIKK